MPRYQLHPPQKLNPAAIGAAVAVVASFTLSLLGFGLYGLLAALAGMGAGTLGFLWGVAPGMKGAMISLLAIGLSVLGLVPAIAAMAGKLGNHP